MSGSYQADTVGAVAHALAPDLVERSIGWSVERARANPYIAAVATVIVLGYAGYKAIEAAWPVIERAWTSATISVKRIQVGLNTPLPEELGGPAKAVIDHHPSHPKGK